MMALILLMFERPMTSLKGCASMQLTFIYFKIRLLNERNCVFLIPPVKDKNDCLLDIQVNLKEISLQVASVTFETRHAFIPQYLQVEVH